MILRLFMATIWGLWFLTWAIASRGVKPVARGDSWGDWLTRQVPYVGGLVLLALPAPSGLLSRRIVPGGDEIAPLLVVLTVCGLGLTLWARRVLGGNWSNVVVLREEHELVTDGPYTLVRHPIYSGLLLAAIAWALADGSVMALIGISLVVGALAVQIRDEERLMDAAFGASYARYRTEVPALLPLAAPARLLAYLTR
ncbi:MAG: isoprenylcysteine carboxylmethyltransferase family protein [Rhodospirillales bacterium]|nr:isoprenylcysteine carboxylmethyltransferase family protein [Rhodospirillales bacterium]